MSSVSVLPHHPSSMSAARKLALALAETAQKASSASQRRSNTPLHVFQRHEAPRTYNRLPRPSALDLQVHPQEHCGPSAQSSAETHCCSHPVHFLSSHLCSDFTDGQESVCNFTPNVSPLGSGSLDEGSAEERDHREENDPRDANQEKHTYQSVGVSTPSQPVSLAKNPSISPIYANTDSVDVYNFRSVLSQSLMPASVEEVFPRQLHTSSVHHYSPEEDRPLSVDENVYNYHHHRHHNQPIHVGRTPEPQCSRPSALPPQLSGPKGLYRQSSEGRYSSLGLRQPLSPQCRHFHKNQNLIGGFHRQQGEWQRSENSVVGHSAIRRARSFHAPQISRYELANTEVLPAETMFYVEPRTSQEEPYRRLIQTSLSSVQPQFENIHAKYQYSPYSNIKPVDGSRYFINSHLQSGIHHHQSYSVHSSRESGQSDYYNYSPHRVPPGNRELYIESRGTVVYEATDAEVFERVIYQPIKQESQSRLKNPYPSLSPCESAVSPSDTRSRDIIHTRSKSDPGNANLLSTDRTEGQTAVVTSKTSPRARQVEPEVTRQRRGHVSGAELRPIPIKEGSSQQLRKVPSLPERGCTKTFEHDRYRSRGHDQDQAMMNNAANSYSCVWKPSALRRPGRSQSTREHRHYYHHAKSPLDPEHLESFSSRLTRRTQSTKVKPTQFDQPTQYDHMEGYYAALRPKSTRSSKAVSGYLPGQSCMSPRGQRLLSQVLGREAFYHTGMRSEAGVFE